MTYIDPHYKLMLFLLKLGIKVKFPDSKHNSEP